MTVYRTVASPIGTLTLAGRGGRLTNLAMEGQARPPGREGWERDADAFEGVVAQLDAYFAGERTDFDVELRPEGTDFERQVWGALAEIPFGEIRTYGEVAAAVGRPRAARAVGAANARNPIAVIVPCHRVVAAGGGLGGYGGGVSRKRWLLDLECAAYR